MTQLATVSRRNLALRWSPSLAVLGLWALSTLFTLAGLALILTADADSNLALLDAMSPTDVVAALSYSAVGAVIVARQPRNIIGWLFAGMAPFSALQVFSSGYTAYSLYAAEQLLPGTHLAAWTASWAWVPPAGLVPLLFLLFPNGRLLSRRWQPLFWFALVKGVVTVLIISTHPFEEMTPHTAANVVDTMLYHTDGLRQALNIGIVSLYLADVMVTGASFLLRFSRSRDEERQQLKWFAYAIAFWVPVVVYETLTLEGFIIVALADLAIAVAVATAILRYRLYDIDLVINATAVYTLLTAMLAGVYSTLLTASQKVFLALTGEESDAAIVLSTLIIAALFAPVKGWLQEAVDNRLGDKRNPAKRLSRLEEHVRAFSEVFDSQRMTELFLQEAVSYMGAECGAFYIGEHDSVPPTHSSGPWDGNTACIVPLEFDGKRIGALLLGPHRRGDMFYGQRDIEVVTNCAAAVAEALALRARSPELRWQPSMTS